LQGESLEDRVRRRPRLSRADLLRIGREIASGLAAAHARGLVHRDVKPANIWLEGDRGRVKLLDFGLVHDLELAARAGSDSLRRPVVGTPSYMSPEQARGDRVDARSDLFSLGCVLYRMATGDNPFK